MNKPLITFEDVQKLGCNNPLLTAQIVMDATRCQNGGQLITKEEALSYAYSALCLAGELPC